MKLYDFSLAPNPRRVRMFLAEKGITVPSVQINTRQREQFSESFRKLNPSCQVPVLELDDGTGIAESVAICRYFEDLQPEPRLMGRDPTDKAIVEMWNRRAEIDGFAAVGEAVRNALPMFADRGLAGVEGGVPQIPALVERGKQTLQRFFQRLDTRLAESRFLAGENFTIADITAFVAIDFAKRVEVEPSAGLTHLGRWLAEIAARPSAKV